VVKQLRRWLVRVLATALLWIWSRLPLGIGLAIGRGIGAAAHFFYRATRARAALQAREALGISDEEAKRLVRCLFRHLGLLMAEMALAPRLRSELDRYVEFPQKDQERLQDALAVGKGVIGVTAHLGHWELLAQRVAHAQIRIVTMARRNRTYGVGPWLVTWRQQGGVETIDRGDRAGGVRILRSLKQGALLAALIDQDTRVPSVFVPFFGKLASTPSGPARIALRAGTPVIAGFIKRTETGHRVSIERIPTDDLAGDEDARVIALTARMTESVERAVRERPEEWVWFHQRWRTRPEQPKT
jgi:KDO2-lipid IV(A) lauroyltransferase